ncbi:GyrI-like domain-containing protein [Paenibacillus thailandensis]|uniref:GyrI-like domain-containing protein n=1 Tax=Paenibacillus thailandensis TaxID=393250 RepID=A0ABW5QV75_9BACL
MDWLERMNGAIGYIEDHLLEEIDYAEAAKIACCSVHHFQRMFSFITEVPLSEYVRRRRLTLAAFDLQSAEAKVIDISLKYGYDSPEAFARAFQNLHGVTPSAVRQAQVRLKAYPRMAITLNIKGAIELNYRIERLESFSTVGFKERVHMDEAFEQIPGIWDNAHRNGRIDQLIKLLWEPEQRGPRGILGICADGGFGTKDGFDYYLAIASDTALPEGMERLNVPEGTWAVFETSEDMDVQGIWKRLYTEWLPTSGYELADIPGIECYHPPGHQPSAEVWIAVRKAGERKNG